MRYTILETLEYYNRPLLFTLGLEGSDSYYLAYWTEDDYYIVSQTDRETLEALVNDQITIREAMMGSPSIVTASFGEDTMTTHSPSTWAQIMPLVADEFLHPVNKKENL